MIFVWCPNEIRNNVSHPDAPKTWTFYKIVRSLGAYFVILFVGQNFTKRINLADKNTTDFIAKTCRFPHHYKLRSHLV